MSHLQASYREQFNDGQITVMDWPAQSTDLNPIKLWDQIKTMVREQNPTSVKELWTAINSAWEGFPSDGLNNLIVSISRRCAAVVMARGGPTNY